MTMRPCRTCSCSAPVGYAELAVCARHARSPSPLKDQDAVLFLTLVSQFRHAEAEVIRSNMAAHISDTYLDGHSGHSLDSIVSSEHMMSSRSPEKVIRAFFFFL